MCRWRESQDLLRCDRSRREPIALRRVRIVVQPRNLPERLAQRDRLRVRQRRDVFRNRIVELQPSPCRQHQHRYRRELFGKRSDRKRCLRGYRKLLREVRVAVSLFEHERAVAYDRHGHSGEFRVANAPRRDRVKIRVRRCGGRANRRAREEQCGRTEQRAAGVERTQWNHPLKAGLDRFGLGDILRQARGAISPAVKPRWRSVSTKRSIDSRRPRARSLPVTAGVLLATRVPRRPSLASQPSFCNLGIGARHRVRRDAQVAGQLTHRRQRHLRSQFAPFDRTANLIRNLPVRRRLDSVSRRRETARSRRRVLECDGERFKVAKFYYPAQRDRRDDHRQRRSEPNQCQCNGRRCGVVRR